MNVRLPALSLAIALLASNLVAASAAPNATPLPAFRDLTSLKRSELTSLPPTTKIKLPKSGKLISLGRLLKQHQARMARFANAAALGRAMLAKLGPPLAIAPHQPSPTLHLGTVIGPVPSPSPPMLSSAALAAHLSLLVPHLLPVETKTSDGELFAKDYDDYCTQAQAAACIYFPLDMQQSYATGDFGGEVDVPETDDGNGDVSGGFSVPQTVITDEDYFVDQQQCTSEYGLWAPNPGECLYLYPVRSTVRWTQTTPPSVTMRGTCVTAGRDGAQASSPFVSTYDPRGVFQLGFADAVISSPTSYTCVVQVTAIPEP